MSRAVLPLVVRSTFFAPKRCSSHALHFLVKLPSPQILCEAMACSIYFISFPVQGGTLKFIIFFPPYHQLMVA